MKKYFVVFHPLLLLALLSILHAQVLEAGIIVILLYEVGFEMRALDELMELNNKLNNFLVKLSKKKRVNKI